MDFRTQNWVRRLDFSALAGWLILSMALAAVSFWEYGVDFRGYYAAARVLAAGGNPYDYRLVAQELLLITGELGNNPYYYPPWFAWIFIPFTTLPFQIARLVWTAVNAVVWSISLWYLGLFINWPSIGWRRYIFFALTTFSFAWITWRYEQAGILIFAMLVLLIRSIEDRRWGWSGIWMALLLIKPNITLVVVMGICLWLLLKRIWQPFVVMALLLAGLLIVSTLITPDWYLPFFQDGFGQGLRVVLDGPNQIVALRINTTLLDWLATIHVERPLRMSIYGITIVAGGVIFLWSVLRSQTILRLTGMLLLISYILTPYALQYDFPPLAIVLFWGLSLCRSSSSTALYVGLLMAGFVFSVLLWQQNIAWAYWMVLGLAILVSWGLWQEKKTAQIKGSF